MTSIPHIALRFSATETSHRQAASELPACAIEMMIRHPSICPASCTARPWRNSAAKAVAVGPCRPNTHSAAVTRPERRAPAEPSVGLLSCSRVGAYAYIGPHSGYRSSFDACSGSSLGQAVNGEASLGKLPCVERRRSLDGPTYSRRQPPQKRNDQSE